MTERSRRRCSEASPIPTRRAIFERLCREGEQTVGALTAQAGVSQPAVSKHLGVLKQAGLVQRPPRRPPDPLQRPTERAGPAGRLDQPNGRLLGEPLRPPRRPAEQDGPMTNTATETRTVVVEREHRPSAGKIWRALTQPHLMAEWLMKNDFKPTVGHSFKLRGEWGGVLDCEVPADRAEQDACPTPGTTPRRWGLRPAERGDLHPDPDAAPARTCAWSRPASAPTRSRPTAAPTPAGSSSSATWTNFERLDN